MSLSLWSTNTGDTVVRCHRRSDRGGVRIKLIDRQTHTGQNLHYRIISCTYFNARTYKITFVCDRETAKCLAGQAPSPGPTQKFGKGLVSLGLQKFPYVLSSSGEDVVHYQLLNSWLVKVTDSFQDHLEMGTRLTYNKPGQEVIQMVK